MKILNPKLTGRAAADEFAATRWDSPRKVGVFDNSGEHYRFQLVHGVKWYVVLPIGYEGWEIVEVS